MATQSISATLITQGAHKFYSGTMDIEFLANSCSPNPRATDPINGFQRSLDEKRAIAIADYIRGGGTIPSSIILSAQTDAQLQYNSKNKTITFEVVQSAFLILDGQHRVYGFRYLLDEGVKYRVPIVIYNDLTLTQEARLFIDINTLQRPVPKELLLDIKRLADRESDQERLLDELFTYFETYNDSFLLNKLSRIDKHTGKISKVTFYDSMRPVVKGFNITNPEKLYRIINSFLQAASDVFDENNFNLDSLITKATLFKILISHSRAVISMIADNNLEDLEKISEHKKYLFRSLPGSFQDIVNSKTYLKSVESLDKKLYRRTVNI